MAKYRKQQLTEPSVEVRDARINGQKYLPIDAGHECPAALSEFCDSGYEPYHLNKAIGFDRVHVNDTGLICEIWDSVFTFFRSSPKCTISAFRATKFCNYRMLDMPRDAWLATLVTFRYGEYDKHAGIAAKIRREFSPFAWVAVMTISNGNPDEDELWRTSLMVDHCDQLLNGTNQPFDNTKRT